MTGPSIFKAAPGHSATLASLGTKQRTAFALLAAGAFVPVLFPGLVRPVFWMAAFQLACVAGLGYIRWRSPALRGSLLVVLVAALACLVALAAALAG